MAVISTAVIAMGVIGPLATACLTGIASPARGSELRADVEQLSKAGESDHIVLIREHAGWGGNCEAIASPALVLDQPPRHGFVCAQAADIKIHSMYLGTESQCIGRRVRGVRLLYRPDPGYAGADVVRYAALYPSVRRSVVVALTLKAENATVGAAPSALAQTAVSSRQASGPVPACSALMF